MPDKSISFIVDEWRFIPNERQIQFTDSQVTIDNRLSKLLEFFCSNPKLTHTRDELIDNVWGGTILTDQAVTQAVFELRKLLKKNSTSKESYIVTVTKRGYRFTGEVKVEKLSLQKPDELTSVQLENPNPAHTNRSIEESAVGSRRKVGRLATIVLSAMVLVLGSMLIIQQREQHVSPIPHNHRLSHFEFRYAVLNVSEDVLSNPELYGVVIKFVEHIGYYSNMRIVKSDEHKKLAAVELDISTAPSRDGTKTRLLVKYHNRVSDQTHLNRRYSTNFARFHEIFPDMIDDLLRAMYIKVPKEELLKNISIFPNDPDALKALMSATGLTYNADFNGAVKHLKQAKQISPDNAYTIALNYISEILTLFSNEKDNQTQRIEELNQEYSLALASIIEKDNNPRVCEAYAILALTEGKSDQASQVLLSIPYNQQTPLTYLLMAKAEEARGHTDGAKELYLLATQNTSSPLALELAGPLFFDSNLDNLIKELNHKQE